jgi:integrase
MGEIIRKTKDGKFIGWYLRYVDADGQRKQRASKQPSFAEAKRMLVEIEARIARGMVGIEERNSETALTLEQRFGRYVEEYRNPRCKNLDRHRAQTARELRRVGKAMPQIARLEVSTLTGSHIAKIREALLDRHQPVTVRTTLSTLAAALGWAAREGLIDKNPAVGVRRPPSPEASAEFLSIDEVRRLLADAERRARTSNAHASLMWWVRWVGVAIGIHTGARKGEIFGLRWSEIDLDRERLTISRSYATTPKSGKTRHLRLPPALVPLLREWKELCPSPLVCPVFHPGKWGMALNPSCEHGLPTMLEAADCRVLPRPWHLLRHSFASHFMQNGGNLLALSQILGHRSVKVTQIYAHLSSDFLDGQMARVKF